MNSLTRMLRLLIIGATVCTAWMDAEAQVEKRVYRFVIEEDVASVLVNICQPSSKTDPEVSNRYPFMQLSSDSNGLASYIIDLDEDNKPLPDIYLDHRTLSRYLLDLLVSKEHSELLMKNFSWFGLEGNLEVHIDASGVAIADKLRVRQLYEGPQQGESEQVLRNNFLFSTYYPDLINTALVRDENPYRDHELKKVLKSLGGVSVQEYWSGPKQNLPPQAQIKLVQALIVAFASREHEQIYAEGGRLRSMTLRFNVNEGVIDFDLLYRRESDSLETKTSTTLTFQPKS